LSGSRVAAAPLQEGLSLRPNNPQLKSYRDVCRYPQKRIDQPAEVGLNVLNQEFQKDRGVAVATATLDRVASSQRNFAVRAVAAIVAISTTRIPQVRPTAVDWANLADHGERGGRRPAGV
jgi:hypothetical protein